MILETCPKGAGSVSFLSFIQSFSFFVSVRLFLCCDHINSIRLIYSLLLPPPKNGGRRISAHIISVSSSRKFIKKKNFFLKSHFPHLNEDKPKNWSIKQKQKIIPLCLFMHPAILWVHMDKGIRQKLRGHSFYLSHLQPSRSPPPQLPSPLHTHVSSLTLFPTPISFPLSQTHKLRLNLIYIDVYLCWCVCTYH